MKIPSLARSPNFPSGSAIWLQHLHPNTRNLVMSGFLPLHASSGVILLFNPFVMQQLYICTAYWIAYPANDSGSLDCFRIALAIWMIVRMLLSAIAFCCGESAAVNSLLILCL